MGTMNMRRMRERFLGLRSGPQAEGVCRELLAPLGWLLPETATCLSDSEAATWARARSGPFVVKVFSAAVLHKSDSGLIRLDCRTPDAVARAHRELAEKAMELGLDDFEIAVQAMAEPGIDLFVGAIRDATFGPLIMFGLGGVHVELLGDVAHALTPIDTQKALRLVQSIRGFPLLNGHRGGTVYPLDGIAALLVSVAQLMTAVGNIAEIDLNPVRLLPDGRAMVLDVAMNLDSDQIVADCSRLHSPQSAMRTLMLASSVAVVGASSDVRKPGGRIVGYLLKHGFDGAIYPVNPRAAEIQGISAFASMEELPTVPDVACIALPAEQVAAALEGCGSRGIPVAVVLASGYAETGPEGAAAQDELVAIARRHGMRLFGPNTNGVVNAGRGLFLSFSQAGEAPSLPAGRVALVSNSGALGGSLISRMLDRGVGFSHWLTLGNEADIDLVDCLDYLVEDDQVEVVALFLEGVRDGIRFRRVLERAHERGKLVVVYKTGTSEAGRRAVSSHSGMLAGSDVAYRVLFRECRVAAVTEVTALAEVATALSWLPAPLGRRVAIISTSGGAGSVTADHAVAAGLQVVGFSGPTRDALKTTMPLFAGTENPLDLTAQVVSDPSMLGRVLELVLAAPDVDAAIVVITSAADPLAGELATSAVEALRRVGEGNTKPKPLVVCWTIARSWAEEGQQRLLEANVPVFEEPARAVAALRLRLEVTGAFDGA